MSLTKKIDFALILKVTNANPNGDPLNGNRPRADFQGFGYFLLGLVRFVAIRHFLAVVS